MTTNENTSKERYCKKCGTPLPSTWKYKQCESCRLEHANKRRAAVGAAGAGLGADLAMLGKKALPLLKKKTVPAVKEKAKNVFRK